MCAEFPSVYGPVRRLWLREARPRVESPCAGAISRDARKSRRSEVAEFPATVDGFNSMALMAAATDPSKANGKRMKPATI